MRANPCRRHKRYGDPHARHPAAQSGQCQEGGSRGTAGTVAPPAGRDRGRRHTRNRVRPRGQHDRIDASPLYRRHRRSSSSRDPPISAAEVALLSEVTDTASAALVSINKIDLIDRADIAGIIAFTRQAITDAVDADVRVLATSFRDRGVDHIACWLTAQITQHGAEDAAHSTARAIRRDASAALDRLRVERQLLQQTRQQHEATVATLEAILQRARDASDTAADRIHGTARRALAKLNTSHTDETTAALKAARAQLGDQLRGPGAPEEQADKLRARLAGLAVRRCASWFDHMAVELGDILQSPADAALTELQDDLAQARQAAEHALKLRLAAVDSVHAPHHLVCHDSTPARKSPGENSSPAPSPRICPPRFAAAGCTTTYRTGRTSLYPSRSAEPVPRFRTG